VQASKVPTHRCIWFIDSDTIGRAESRAACKSVNNANAASRWIRELPEGNFPRCRRESGGEELRGGILMRNRSLTYGRIITLRTALSRRPATTSRWFVSIAQSAPGDWGELKSRGCHGPTCRSEAADARELLPRKYIDGNCRGCSIADALCVRTFSRIFLII